MSQTLQLWQIWLCLVNNREYQIIDLSDQEVVATTDATVLHPMTWGSHSGAPKRLALKHHSLFVDMIPGPSLECVHAEN